MRNGFTFGEYSSWDFDAHVEKYPRISAPARKMQTFSVAGRNGDLHIMEDAWENYTQPYEIYFHGKRPSPEQARAIKAWLFSPDGYQRLEDVYDPEIYRMAICKGPLDIENRLNKYGRCTLQFDCAPQSYLKGGEDPLWFLEAGKLYNSTAFDAQPIITVYGTAAGTVTVGSTVVEIKAISNPIILDCEQMQAYSQPGEGAPESQNGNIYAPKFPVLAPGDNAIAFTGGITKLQIIPRWWTL